MVLSLISVFFLYNKSGSNVSAQEVLCLSPEIPVGTAIDETYAFAQELLQHLQLAVSYSMAQAALSEQLAELPDECKAENCSSGCNTITNSVFCGKSRPCPDDCAAWPCSTSIDPDTGLCSKECTEYSCQITSCSGDPCPTTEINNLVDAINRLHGQIAAERQAIEKLLENEYNSDSWKFCREETKDRLIRKGEMTDKRRRDLVACLLEESRIGLSNCVTPAQFFAGTSKEEVKLLYSCQEARLQGLLTDVQAEQCTVNNAFCCDLQ